MHHADELSVHFKKAVESAKKQHGVFGRNSTSDSRGVIPVTVN